MLLFSQTHDTFNVAGTGEKVKRCYFIAYVSEILEPFDVAGESCGVAGNVHHALRRERGDEIYQLLGAAGTGRVEDDDVGGDLFAEVALGGVEQALAV